MPGKEENHEQVHHILVGEINNACFKLADLEKHKLPSEAIRFEPAKVFSSMGTSSGHVLYDLCKKQWIDWPSDDSYNIGHGVAEAQIAQCINNIGQSIAKHKKIGGPPRKWTAKYSNSPVPHSRCLRKPDIVLMNADDADGPIIGTTGWPSIFAVAELKTGDNSGGPLMKLAHSAQLIFGAQPDRQYVLGFTVHRETMTFVVFNRAGLFVSDAFNVHEHPERLIHVIGGLMFAGRKHIGFDPTLKFTPFDEPLQFRRTIEVNGNTYDICELLHVETVIRGRATVCFKVKRTENIEEKFYVIKNGWVDESHGSKEPAILEELRGISGITQIKEYETISASTHDDVEASFKRGWISEEGAKDLREKVDLRKQLRIVMTPVGSSILQFGSLKELVYAFIKIVEALELMHERKLLHRDISPQNVLLDDSDDARSANGERGGLLIDFDYTIPDNPEHNQADRIGTLPFMAIELLTTVEPIKQKYYHDLESVFYVLCYICCVCEKSGGILRKQFDVYTTSMGDWFGKKYQSAEQIGKAKKETVDSKYDLTTNILSAMSDHFEPIKPFLVQLRLVAIPPSRCKVDYCDEFYAGGAPDDRDVSTQHMWQRKPRRQFAAFRGDLERAYIAMPGPGDGNSPQEPITPVKNIVANGLDSPVTPPGPITAGLHDRGDAPLRPIGLLTPVEDENANLKTASEGTKDADAASAGAGSAKVLESNSDAQGNAAPTSLHSRMGTLVGSSSLRSRKRKIKVLEEEAEDSSDRSDALDTPTPVGRSRERLLRAAWLNPPSVDYGSGGQVPPSVTEDSKLGETAEIKSSGRASTKRQRTA